MRCLNLLGCGFVLALLLGLPDARAQVIYEQLPTVVVNQAVSSTLDGNGQFPGYTSANDFTLTSSALIRTVDVPSHGRQSCAPGTQPGPALELCLGELHIPLHARANHRLPRWRKSGDRWDTQTAASEQPQAARRCVLSAASTCRTHNRMFIVCLLDGRREATREKCCSHCGAASRTFRTSSDHRSLQEVRQIAMAVARFGG
jgi:hypothetical protein